MRRSPAVWFASHGLSLLGKGIASAVLPLLVLDRTGDVLAAGLLATAFRSLDDPAPVHEPAPVDEPAPPRNPVGAL